MSGDQWTLTDREREFLRELAGKAVDAAARSAPAPNPHEMARRAHIDLEPRLSVPRGAFVTLTSGGRLRGCIGYIEGIKPLVDAVIENRRSAAVAAIPVVVGLGLRLGLRVVVGRWLSPRMRIPYWLVPLRDFLNLAIWALGLLGRSVQWRGSDFVLLPDGNLALVENA